MWKYWGDDSEHVLLLQRAWVQVPASTPGGSEPPVISAPTPLASAGPAITCTHHTHNFKKASEILEYYLIEHQSFVFYIQNVSTLPQKQLIFNILAFSKPYKMRLTSHQHKLKKTEHVSDFTQNPSVITSIHETSHLTSSPFKTSVPSNSRVWFVFTDTSLSRLANFSLVSWSSSALASFLREMMDA